LNVSLNEELDQIMIGLPLGPFSEIGACSRWRMSTRA